MAETTEIGWADSTFNPWIGCSKVSPGCDHCYAERNFDHRLHMVTWGAGQSRHRTGKETWDAPLRWQRQAAQFFARHGRRRRVFCASLADVFDNEVDPQWRVDLFALIRSTPDLDWLLLTKRIGNAHEMMDDIIGHELDMGSDPAFDSLPWPNVWIGATVVDQAEADRDIPKLLAVPAVRRFVSIEPMLGEIDLRRIVLKAAKNPERGEPPVSIDSLLGWHGGADEGRSRLDWVICGGESGPNLARPMHPDWARNLRDQCESAGVPFFFKQWGEWTSCGPESMGYPVVNGVPRLLLTDAGENGQRLGARGGKDCWMQRIGTKAAGRLLDGREHSEFPSSAVHSLKTDFRMERTS